MFDLGKLRVVRRDDPLTRGWSFVGIRRNPENGQPEFWLPQGFQDFPSASYDAVVEIFFLLYRVMRTFAIARGLRDHNERPGKEPFEHARTGTAFSWADDDALPTFAKLSLLEGILESFDELVIASILSKETFRPPESYEEIHKHLHRAIYLPNDVIYLEEQPTRRAEVLTAATELVRMFSYVYVELAGRLVDMDRMNPSVIANAEAFKEEWLPDTAGLFTAEGFELTVSVLKARLDAVYRATAYKDEDFWKLFRALEVFLYSDIDRDPSDDGVMWGISDYHPIWEDMCHVYCREYFAAQNATVLFAHSPRGANARIARQPVYDALQPPNPFALALNGRQRRLLPDLVVHRPPSRGSNTTEAERLVLQIEREEGARGYYKTVLVHPRRPSYSAWSKWLKQDIHKLGFPGREQGLSLVYRAIPKHVFERGLGNMARAWSRVRARDPDVVFLQDFKYMHHEEFLVKRPGEKLRADVAKQSAYTLALQSYRSREMATWKLSSQFLIPYYDQHGDEPYYVVAQDTWRSLAGFNAPPSPLLTDRGIDLVALPFQRVADAYVGGS